MLMADRAPCGYLSIGEGGVRLRVRLTPRSARSGIDGVTPTADGAALKARVRAVPEDGKANAALEALIADWLGLARSTVAVVSGHTSRVKIISIAGNGATLARDIAKRIGSLEAGNGGRG